MGHSTLGQCDCLASHLTTHTNMKTPNQTYRESFPGNAGMRINLDFKITTK